jgi:hypothetical protein
MIRVLEYWIISESITFILQFSALSLYLSQFLKKAKFTISSTTRFKSEPGRPEACVIAKINLIKGDQLPLCSGMQYQLTEEQLLCLGSKDFSLIQRNDVPSMYLGKTLVLLNYRFG